MQAKLAQELGDVSKADIDRLLKVSLVTTLSCELYCFYKLLMLFVVAVAGVLLQPGGDVVPQRNRSVMTPRDLQPLSFTGSQSERLPGAQRSSGQSHTPEPITART